MFAPQLRNGAGFQTLSPLQAFAAESGTNSLKSHCSKQLAQVNLALLYSTKVGELTNESFDAVNEKKHRKDRASRAYWNPRYKNNQADRSYRMCSQIAST